MNTQRFEQRLAASGTFKIKKYSTDDHQIHINEIFITGDTSGGTVAFADGSKTITFDVGQGPIQFCMGLVFKGDSDITVTATGSTATVICDVSYKK